MLNFYANSGDQKSGPHTYMTGKGHLCEMDVNGSQLAPLLDISSYLSWIISLSVKNSVGQMYMNLFLGFLFNYAFVNTTLPQ